MDFMHPQLLSSLGLKFDQAGHRLFLVGGSVRDKLLNREVKDWDFTTTAKPDEIQAILASWADAIWDVGARFGTIAARRDGFDVEITTMRTDGPGRKPEVAFTEVLEEDLQRRDFTINAMAMQVTQLGLNDHVIDPFNGKTALSLGLLKTPMDPVKTFTDDPLRMMRAVRFAAQLGFKVGDAEKLAIAANRELIHMVSAERKAVEMDRMLMSPDPFRGLSEMLHTGLLKEILPELIAAPSIKQRATLESAWADLLLEVDPHKVTDITKRFRMSVERQRSVTNLVTWVQRFQEVSEWTWPMVRRVVAISGDLLPQLEELLGDDILSGRIETLLEAEGHPEPFLSGAEVMDLTGLSKGPRVGEALRFLWELRLDEGKLTHEDVISHLADWMEAS
jgi:poly(A) polymerase